MRNRWLWMIVLIAAVTRLGFGLWRDAGDAAVVRAMPDQLEYLQLGRNLLHGNGLVLRDDRLGIEVRAFRAPGYPLLVAVCGGNVRIVRVAQALIDTSTVLAIYLLARRWLSERQSLIAAALVAINPFLIYLSSLVLSETLFIAMLAWGMALLSRRAWWWWGAVLLALSVLVRPGAIGLPIVLALASSMTGRSFLRPAVALLVIIMVLLPWAFRNHRVLGRWVWTSTNDGMTIYDGFHEGATGASDQTYVIYMRDELTAKSEVERSQYLAGLAWRWMRDDPGEAIRLALTKIARTWSPVPLSREYGGNPLTVLAAAAYAIPLFGLTLMGLLTRSPLPRAAKVFLMVPAIYFTAAVAFSVGSLRYRLPADVPMAVVAASAVRDQWSNIKGQKKSD